MLIRMITMVLFYFLFHICMSLFAHYGLCKNELCCCIYVCHVFFLYIYIYIYVVLST